jgi:hypothetical protein
MVSGSTLGRKARMFRAAHSTIGVGELACLCYVWFCAIGRRRDPWLRLAVVVLIGEGTALLLAKGCPLGVLQRRAGDDVPMFELWFGTRVAPFAVPAFTLIAVGGLALVLGRPPREIDLPATPCDSDVCSCPFPARPVRSGVPYHLSGRFADQTEKARRGRRKWPICRPHDPD